MPISCHLVWLDQPTSKSQGMGHYTQTHGRKHTDKLSGSSSVNQGRRSYSYGPHTEWNNAPQILHAVVMGLAFLFVVEDLGSVDALMMLADRQRHNACTLKFFFCGSRVLAVNWISIVTIYFVSTLSTYFGPLSVSLLICRPSRALE